MALALSSDIFSYVKGVKRALGALLIVVFLVPLQGCQMKEPVSLTEKQLQTQINQSFKAPHLVPVILAESISAQLYLDTPKVTFKTGSGDWVDVSYKGQFEIDFAEGGLVTSAIPFHLEGSGQLVYVAQDKRFYLQNLKISKSEIDFSLVAIRSLLGDTLQEKLEAALTRLPLFEPQQELQQQLADNPSLQPLISDEKLQLVVPKPGSGLSG